MIRGHNYCGHLNIGQAIFYFYRARELFSENSKYSTARGIIEKDLTAMKLNNTGYQTEYIKCQRHILNSSATQSIVETGI